MPSKGKLSPATTYWQCSYCCPGYCWPAVPQGHSTQLAHAEAGVHQGSQTLSCKATSQPAGPQPLVMCVGTLLNRCRTWHFPLLNSMRFLWTDPSSLPRSLWMVAQPSGVSATLPSLQVKLAEGALVHPHLRVHWYHLRSLMRVFNSIGPSTDLKSASLVTGLQLDFAPLIIISWAWHCSLFSIYFTICLSSQQLVNDDRASDESLSEVKMINILCSLLVHQASHLITEGYQADQA